MDWQDMFFQDNKPTPEQIKEFINNPLWDNLNNALISTYNVEPKLEYSKCSMQRGWNVKYKKRGKSLCTLYPQEGSFKALVIVNESNRVEVDLFINTCCDYIKQIYSEIDFFNSSKWLMIQIDNISVLNDTLELIKFRA
ncbi:MULTISPECIES: DUF3788 domain-containing protein [Clostridioides]|uniref:DUF3788 domain-containing protein n=1 Tax=Clostridioides sp. ZZV14-6387 TaxID=2811497 RepID=UPI0006BBDD2F|nr:hypothetical protein KW95_01860 [Clostridioides difficile]MCC0693606.1 DUF3788 domain-containing protein [Clostridioides sp. ZZV14-6387]MDB3085841.1 DUF3788 domain-containing protein [Clostridioides difficile]MDI0266998.1 DUF3788 domain-containing protein [Clostridioides difficile]MDI7818330.1 DUF3788 domain-containing protein [Clostridioides difficile]